MENQIKKFFEFNGKNVYFKAIDGKWWIAIKPILRQLDNEIVSNQLELWNLNQVTN